MDQPERELGKEVRCGEFFSGVGAMHLGLNEAFSDCRILRPKVMVAFDINQIANATYKHNFGISPQTVLIEHKPLSYYEKLELDAWLLSPPCQPFTRGGKQRDQLDERSAGLLYLINVLSEMKNAPKYLFLENVLNFEVSECHRLLLQVLGARGYKYEEYLVSPMDIGVPNDRLRYYLIAVKDSVCPAAVCGSNIITSFKQIYDKQYELRQIKDYLLDLPEDELAGLKVPERYIRDYKNYKHDIAHPMGLRSTTFTKAYGSDYIIGTGSFLQSRRLELTEYKTDDQELLLTLGLRFFAPKEVANLHCFPANFEFPEATSKIQKYRLLGNSMNVRVVSILLHRLFFQL